ncbi:MAG: hypothetical protein M3041_18020 [Acidobacteriota bacterium]|nr:hypothetical protein [Acidobacteriota bacterium]
MLVAAVLFATATLSQRLTSAAEELLRIEKKIAATHDLDALLYEDVLTLLDEALDADPHNLHAHARAGEVLVLKSKQSDGTFDICSLLDARDEADFVLSHGAEAGDQAIARGVRRSIDSIPQSAIPDPPSSCGDSDEGRRHGTKTRSS